MNFDDYLPFTKAYLFLGVPSHIMSTLERKGKIKSEKNPFNGFRMYKKSDLEQLKDQLCKK